VNALDYLLKPIDPARLAAALARVRRPDAPPATEAAPLERVFIRDGDDCWLVRLDEVRLFAADGNYVHVHWGARDLMLARSLATLEARLDARRFFRANRAQIIHLDFVESIDAGPSGRLYVKLRGGPEVEVSRRQARLLRQRLGG
jgi:two-component system LytT family response regulator